MSWGRPKSEPAALAALRRELESERERAGRLAAVLESVDSAVLALDGEQRRLFANAAAERLLPSLQRLPQLLQWVEGVAGSGEAWASRLELPDERTLQVYITPLGAPASPLRAGCVVVARDITATARLETARRDFIAAISHELRTPLTSIQGYAELLQQNPELPAPQRADYLEIMTQNAVRLSRLARDLVTLSSIETGTYPFHFELIEAAALAAPAVAVMAPLARELGSRLEAGPAAAGRVRADRDALHRVLLNLIENALLHGGSGVTVDVSGQVEGDDYIYRVHDTGAGISSTDQPRVFERFYRVEQSRIDSSSIAGEEREPASGRRGGGAPESLRRAAAGTGLGLALVKHIVLEHGGQVKLQSALGQGSTFSVRLPLVQDDAAGERR